jgi:hypothetical protein
MSDHAVYPHPTMDTGGGMGSRMLLILVILAVGVFLLFGVAQSAVAW